MYQKNSFGDGLNVEVRKAIDEAIETYKKLGAEIVEVSLPSTKYALSAYYIIALAEASSNLARYDGVSYGLRVPADNLVEMSTKTRTEGFWTRSTTSYLARYLCIERRLLRCVLFESS